MRSTRPRDAPSSTGPPEPEERRHNLDELPIDGQIRPLVGQMTVYHLALAVEDEQRSRTFYERCLGFDARPPRRCPDGVLMLYDADGFALALGPAEGPPRLPRFFHVGLAMGDRSQVLSLLERLRADGVEIVEEWDEPESLQRQVPRPRWLCDRSGVGRPAIAQGPWMGSRFRLLDHQAMDQP